MCDSRLLVPATVTEKLPLVEPETVRIDEPDPVTLDGLRVAVMVGEEVVVERFTTLLKP